MIGSGVSGLAAAWLLGGRHHITVFERSSSLGLGHQGYKTPGRGGDFLIDIPPRVINHTHYRHLFDLIGEAGVETYTIRQQPSFSFPDRSTYLSFRTFIAFGTSLSLPRLGRHSWRWLLQHGGELRRWFSWIHSASPAEVEVTARLHGNTNIAGLLLQQGYSPAFIHGFLFPMWSLICTCDYQHLNSFPITDLVAVFRAFTGKAVTRRILGGTTALENKIVSRISCCHLNTQVRQLSAVPGSDRISIHTDDSTAEFDQVIIATEPSHARELVREMLPEESDLIGCVPVYETRMVMHTDPSLMPLHRSDWAPVNMFWDRELNRSSSTLWMNQLESHDNFAQSYFQSWDPVRAPDPAKVLASRTFRRSLATPASQKAMAALRERMAGIHDRRVWFVGSYLTEGVPLLENGVHSAGLVCQWMEKNCGAKS